MTFIYTSISKWFYGPTFSMKLTSILIWHHSTHFHLIFLNFEYSLWTIKMTNFCNRIEKKHWKISQDKQNIGWTLNEKSQKSIECISVYTWKQHERIYVIHLFLVHSVSFVLNLFCFFSPYLYSTVFPVSLFSHVYFYSLKIIEQHFIYEK